MDSIFPFLKVNYYENVFKHLINLLFMKINVFFLFILKKVDNQSCI